MKVNIENYDFVKNNVFIHSKKYFCQVGFFQIFFYLYTGFIKKHRTFTLQRTKNMMSPEYFDIFDVYFLEEIVLYLKILE